jgi:hypothetical protein
VTIELEKCDESKAKTVESSLTPVDRRPGNPPADKKRVWTRDKRSSIMKALIIGGPGIREDGNNESCHL